MQSPQKDAQPFCTQSAHRGRGVGRQQGCPGAGLTEPRGCPIEKHSTMWEQLYSQTGLWARLLWNSKQLFSKTACYDMDLNMQQSFAFALNAVGWERSSWKTLSHSKVSFKVLNITQRPLQFGPGLLGQSHLFLFLPSPASYIPAETILWVLMIHFHREISFSLVQCFGKLFPASLIAGFELFQFDKYLFASSMKKAHVHGNGCKRKSNIRPWHRRLLLYQGRPIPRI